MKKVVNLVSFAFMALCPVFVRSQTNEGLHFWLGFMEHRNIGQNAMVAMITSKYNTSGVVRMPLRGWLQTFQVAANSVTIVKLPSFAENVGSEKTDLNGVEVEAQLPVSVYTHQYHSMRSEATVVLPVESLGQEYYVMSYNGYQEGGEVYPSEFLLVGMEDDTDITVTVSDQTRGGKAKGTSFTVNLDAGETYQVQAAVGSGDLSGSYLVGNKKFNVFGGCRWVQVPVGCNFRDNLLEQMIPVSTWGKQFVTAPHANMPYDVFRIMASENGTEVTVQGATTQQYTLAAGAFVEYRRSEPTYIVASKPVTVAQYLIGSGCSGYPVGDPAMLILNSVEQIRDTVTLYNSSLENITENYINVITKTDDINVTYFDGKLLTDVAGAVIQPVGANPVFSFARIRVQPGAHTIISGGCGVIASAYGYGNVESYSYGGGASFKPINANSLIPEGGCLNDTILFVTGFKPPRHTLVWNLGDGTTRTDPVFTHTYSALGAYPVTLYLTDNCLGIQDTITRDLLVTLRQSVAVAGDPEGCEGETIALGAEDLPGARYEWRGPNQYFSFEQFPVLSDIGPQQAGIYQVTGVISGCATHPATAEVTVHPLPQPFLGNDTIVCGDEHYPLLTLNPGAYEKYRWQNNAHTPTFDVTREGSYWVQVTDENGCTGADSIFVRDLCPTRYYIPNVFSPNDDGVNDYFSIFGSDLLGLKLSIFDRWGNLLFESTDTDARWDGYYRGKAMTPGVYVWVAQIEGYRRDGSFFSTTEKGAVTLVR